MRDLSDARILVLGGSGALGGAVAEELTRRGARVVLSGRSSERLQHRAASLGGVPSVIGDLTQPHHARHTVATAVDMLGGLDGIVNAAGVVAFGPINGLDDAVLDELVAVDFVGPLRVIREAEPHLEDGFIANITGVVAEQPVAGMTAYSAVKSGLSAATRALGRELRRRKIVVIDVRPPHTETGLAGRPIAGEAPEMPPGLDPADVARVIVDGIATGKRELAAADFG